MMLAMEAYRIRRKIMYFPFGEIREHAAATDQIRNKWRPAEPRTQWIYRIIFWLLIPTPRAHPMVFVTDVGEPGRTLRNSPNPLRSSVGIWTYARQGRISWKKVVNRFLRRGDNGAANAEDIIDANPPGQELAGPYGLQIDDTAS